ncbi:P27 family phage terminase small subunit [Pseudorhodoferax sp. Leaf274]|uniref:P27 family phage terminase small subunit n=1 Tax=Pseudorhodoferax sp. Leaf274 TaxID=1736318 RepID=UPI000702AC60|nr:P27 family phage terminase small subunit [Pseudorhodoferax sp. Leaf274]KQP37565.1 hypothetical protein ASF44_14580 [Pseudorhodoferax sp. Leaf274]
MDGKTNFTAALPAVGGARVVSAPGAITSPKPPPMLDLSPDELALYEHICGTLREAGIEHLTASMPIAIIVRTFADWLKACAECDDKGRTQTSKTGWATPTPWADDEKRLKMELGQWLPKACLTIPSLARVRKDTGDQGKQDDLFAEVVGHAITSPASASRH